MTKHLARLLLASGIALALLAPSTGVTARPAAVSQAAAHAATRSSAADRSFAVGVRTYTLVDTSRPTAAHGTVPGKPTRTLVTTVFYPARGPAGPNNIPNAKAAVGKGPFPLIVFSHGFTANGPAYGLLLRRFAEAGYVVAAPTYPLSSGGTPGGPVLGDYVNQPGDVSFVIDEMLRLDRTRHSGLTDLIARHHIAAAGHSLGAITTLGFLNSCCIDKRIDAAVPISGILLPFPGGTYTFPKIPLLLIHGDADGTVPYGASVAAYAQARAPKFFLTLIGGPHTPFFGPAGEPIVNTMTDFFNRYLKGQKRAIRQLVIDAANPGVTSLQAALR